MQSITSAAGSAHPTNIIKIVNFDILVREAWPWCYKRVHAATKAPNYRTARRSVITSSLIVPIVFSDNATYLSKQSLTASYVGMKLSDIINLQPLFLWNQLNGVGTGKSQYWEQL